MSWNQIWKLTRRDYSPEEILTAVKSAVAEFPGAALVADPDGLDAYNAYDLEDGIEDNGAYFVTLPPSLLLDAGDAPPDPEDDEPYTGVILVEPPNLTPEEGGDELEWSVVVDSDSEDNRIANLAISAIAARLSVLLGGSAEVEPLV